MSTGRAGLKLNSSGATALFACAAQAACLLTIARGRAFCRHLLIRSAREPLMGRHSLIVPRAIAVVRCPAGRPCGDRLGAAFRAWHWLPADRCRHPLLAHVVLHPVRPSPPPPLCYAWPPLCYAWFASWEAVSSFTSSRTSHLPHPDDDAVLCDAGNLRTSDKAGPYNLTLLPVQVNEIKGALGTSDSY